MIKKIKHYYLWLKDKIVKFDLFVDLDRQPEIPMDYSPFARTHQKFLDSKAKRKPRKL